MYTTGLAATIHLSFRRPRAAWGEIICFTHNPHFTKKTERKKPTLLLVWPRMAYQSFFPYTITYSDQACLFGLLFFLYFFYFSFLFIRQAWRRRYTSLFLGQGLPVERFSLFYTHTINNPQYNTTFLVMNFPLIFIFILWENKTSVL
jgi:hypothetical protein